MRDAFRSPAKLTDFKIYSRVKEECIESTAKFMIGLIFLERQLIQLLLPKGKYEHFITYGEIKVKNLHGLLQNMP